VESDSVTGKRTLELLDPKVVAISRVGDLASALEALSEEPMDLVLLNPMLPDAGGIHSLKRILKQEPEVCVIIVNGPDDEVFALSTIREGAQDYIGKTQMGERSLRRAMDFALLRETRFKALIKPQLHQDHAENKGVVSSSGEALDSGRDLTEKKSFSV